MRLLHWGRVALHLAAVLVTGKWGKVARAVDEAIQRETPPAAPTIPDEPSKGG